MGLLDYVSAPGQKVAYLFPEVTPDGTTQLTRSGQATPVGGGIQLSAGGAPLKDVFVFQYWPSQVTDSYTPNYATKQIPGASHPLYQWVGGSGRTISFNATFTAEVREDSATLNAGFTARVQAASAGAVGAAGNAIGAALLPSSRYTVNVAAALASLQQYLYPTYDGGDLKRPPSKLILVLPGTHLGRSVSADGVLCILKQANVTMESWFPTGEMRAATVALQFAEIIQYSSGEGSNIRYIGAEAYRDLANSYQLETLSNPSDITL